MIKKITELKIDKKYKMKDKLVKILKTSNVIIHKA